MGDESDQSPKAEVMSPPVSQPGASCAPAWARSLAAAIR
jgi:hypothetical protein